MSKVEYLVVDSGGFIKNAPLREIATNIVTLREVVDEIRDKPTRQRLQALPYELVYRKPSTAGLKFVSDFAKKTGDYASLSAVDIMVLAVTYDLELERIGGADHLNREPVTKRTVEFYKPEKGIPAGDKHIAGFYDPNSIEEENKPSEESYSSFEFWRDPIQDVPLDFDLELEAAPKDKKPEITSLTKEDYENLNKYLAERSFLCSFDITDADHFVYRLIDEKGIVDYCNVLRWYKHIRSYKDNSNDTSDFCLALLKEKLRVGESFKPEEISVSNEADATASYTDEFPDEGIILEYSDSDKENDNDNADNDDEEGWITPANLREKKAQIAGQNLEEERKPVVACITTDFAMQNVLKQIGLSIIGANGMVIKETKTWILRCYSCSKTTPQLERKFCPKCGNKTLKRVSVTLNTDGSQQIHISTRRPISTKGKKFSLPAPRGGKHGVNPILSEDQREAQQRLSKKAIQKNNPLDPDYIAGNSPFLTKDVTSRSAMLGLKGPGLGQAAPTGLYWAKKNPNAAGKNTGNKKKRN